MRHAADPRPPVAPRWYRAGACVLYAALAMFVAALMVIALWGVTAWRWVG